MNFQRMTDLDLAGKRVLIREDLNVPVKNGVITSDARLRAALPTIKAALEKGAAVMVYSHLGRPVEGEPKAEQSLAPVAAYLTEALGQEVKLFADYLDGVDVQPGQVVLLENCRFNAGEKKNNPELAAKYAALCDVFVMDAFGTAHRAEASTEGVARLAKVAAAGPLLAAELDALGRVLKTPEKPMAAIVAGSKVSTKLDEVLAPGDLLYVPPGLSHYGVAEDDCLTFSFGFRMPNVPDMMDRICDKFSENDLLKNPLLDIVRSQQSSMGQMTQNELEYLKEKIFEQLQNSTVIEDAIVSLMSEPRYPENIPEAEAIGTGDLEEALEQGYLLMLEPASRLLYTDQDGELLFWANGENICISAQFAPHLKKLADGQAIDLNETLFDQDILEDIAQLMNESVLMLLPADSEE
jgi:hypothetical protein